MKSLDVTQNLFNPIIPWDIRPKDCFDNDISINDEVIFILTNYKNYFKKICKGKIVGFTKCFIKIKPDNPNDHYSFYEYINGKKIPKEFILKKPNRVYKIE